MDVQDNNTTKSSRQAQGKQELPPSSSDLLEELKKHPGEKITLGEIVAGFREGGFSILLIIFASPLALPLPAVGIATVMSIPIILLSAQLAYGSSSPWLPKWLAKKELKMSFLIRVVDKILPYLAKFEVFIKPRLSLLSTSFGHKIIGLVCIICSLSVATPLPFSNTVPSMGIVLMSIGLLERDGIIIIGGMTIGALGVAIACAIYYFGLEAIKALFGF